MNRNNGMFGSYRFFSILVVFIFSFIFGSVDVFGANITSAQPGNWNATTTWVGGVVPGINDNATINHRIVVDSDVIVGESLPITQGPGMITVSGNNVTGTSTTFTTSFRVGDVIQYGANIRFTVVSIIDDTRLKIGNVTTAVTSPIPYSIRKRAIYQTAPLIVATSTSLTIRGDHNVRGTTLYLSPGSSYIFDSSSVGTTTQYITRLGAGENAVDGSIFLANGTPSQRIKIRSVSTGNPGFIVSAANQDSMDANYVDWQLIGDTATPAYRGTANAVGKRWKFDNNTFDQCGVFSVGSAIALGADFVFTYNRLIAPPNNVTTGQFIQVEFLLANGTPTGLRKFHDNMLTHTNKRIRVNGNSFSNLFPVQRNMMYMFGGGSPLANPQLEYNFFHLNTRNADYSFVGRAGTVIDRNYVFLDAGPNQGPGNLMSEDQASDDGVWTYKRSIIERSGPLASNETAPDITHAIGTVGKFRTIKWQNILMVPSSSGTSGGPLLSRGWYDAIVEATNITGLNNNESGASGTGLVASGAIYYGENRTVPVTGATNASPIVITSNAHGLENGLTVTITGVTGNTAANGRWIIANKTANTFALASSTGNGVYTGGGSATTLTPVTDASNTSPIVITAPLHGLYNGMTVTVYGVTGNTGANGDFKVANVTTNTFELVSSTGNGVYTGGGTIARHNISVLKNILSWAKQVYSGTKNTGFLSGYGNTTGDRRADYINPAGISNNAHYNGRMGLWYDANGLNATSTFGYHGYWNTNRPSLATDINLGTSTNEMTSGPQFVDSTRNVATFDTAYLGNDAINPGTGYGGVVYNGRGAWANNTNYEVNDVVSSQSPGFYNNTVINYRAIKKHTSSDGNTINGRPGGAGITDWRTNWEFMSITRLRDRWMDTVSDASLGVTNRPFIELFYAWVWDGFRPQNELLRGAGFDGSDIGAVPMK